MMKDYYAKRVKEYEEIYHRDDPVRQAELLLISKTIKRIFKDKKVLEIACGTGYWTKILSESADSILATDKVSEVIEMAKTKKYKCPVTFRIADTYNLPFQKATFTGGLANLWFSHIPKSKIDSFLKGFHRVLGTGSVVFMADNIYIPGIGGELVHKNGDENTYKLRKLKDGSEYLILKNYFNLKELAQIFRKHSPNFTEKNIFYGKCFWYVFYRAHI